MPTAATAEHRRATVWEALAGARAALMLLTRIPVSASGLSVHAWSWAAAWFPLVGVLVGAIATAVWWATAAIGALPAAVLAVTVSIVLTGALHEDGLADSADALGGAQDRDAIFRILKDSRVGTYGAVAIVLSLLWRVSLLASLGEDALGALIFAHTVARLMPAWLLALLPYVTPAATKNPSLAGAAPSCVIVATALAGCVAAGLMVTGVLSPPAVVTALVLAGVATALLGRWFRRRAGGVTGDFLGATEQAGECLVLLAIAGA